MKTTICIFLPTGKTFTFRDAWIALDNENVLEIAYTAMSDGRSKRATFQKSAIAGWAVTQLGNDRVPAREKK